MEEKKPSASAPVGTVEKWRLVKYEGDAPAPGEHKTPIEIIEGGDGQPTVRSYPAQEGAPQNATD